MNDSTTKSPKNRPATKPRRATLTKTQAADYARGKATLRSLATALGRSPETVRRILHRDHPAALAKAAK